MGGADRGRPCRCRSRRTLIGGLGSLVLIAAVGLGQSAAPVAAQEAGEVEIFLEWSGSADLDLHVREPSGFEIYYEEGFDVSPATGGALDVDNRAECPDPGQPIDTDVPHMEHVRWLDGTAETGTYRAWVHYYDGVRLDGDALSQCDFGEMAYRIGIRVDREEVIVDTGRLTYGQRSDPIVYELQRIDGEAAITDASGGEDLESDLDATDVGEAPATSAEPPSYDGDIGVIPFLLALALGAIGLGALAGWGWMRLGDRRATAGRASPPSSPSPPPPPPELPIDEPEDLDWSELDVTEPAEEAPQEPPDDAEQHEPEQHEPEESEPTEQHLSDEADDVDWSELDDTEPATEDAHEEQQDEEEEEEDDDQLVVSVQTDRAEVTTESGAKVRVVAQVHDATGAPMSGRTVEFDQPPGFFIALGGATDVRGEVHADWHPDQDSEGDVRIGARCGSAASSCVVVLRREDPAELFVSLTPRRLPADGTSTATVSAEVYTAELRPMAGIEVRFGDGEAGGRMSAAPPSDGEGRTSATYTMPGETTVDDITITAEIDRPGVRPVYLKRDATLHVVGDVLRMWSDRERVRPGDPEPTAVRVRVQSEGGDPRPDVMVQAELDDPRAGNIDPVSLTTDHDGYGVFEYQPGVADATVTVTATLAAGADTQGSVEFDQSCPHFDVADTNSPNTLLRVQLAHEQAAFIGADDVVGALPLDASCSARGPSPGQDLCLLAAVIGTTGTDTAHPYRQRADELRQRKRAASEAAEHAYRKIDDLDVAADRFAFVEDLFATLYAVGDTVDGLVGVAAGAPVASATTTSVSSALWTVARGVVSNAVAAKTFATSLAVAVSDHVSELADTNIDRALEIRLLQATALDEIAIISGRLAQLYDRIGPGGGPASEAEQVLPLAPRCAAWTLQEAELRFLCLELDSLDERFRVIRPICLAAPRYVSDQLEAAYRTARSDTERAIDDARRQIDESREAAERSVLALSRRIEVLAR